MSDDDTLDAIAEAHVPVDVSAEMRQASPPPAERVTIPAGDHVVDRIAKRETAEAGSVHE